MSLFYKKYKIKYRRAKVGLKCRSILVEVAHSGRGIEERVRNCVAFGPVDWSCLPLAF